MVDSMTRTTMRNADPNGRRRTRKLAVAIVAIAFLIRALTIFYYGPHVSLHSDDMGYWQSALWLLQTGVYSYYAPYVPTIHMMPGITYLLVLIIKLFGTGSTALYAGKLVMSIIGAAGVIAVYLIGTRVWSPWVGAIGALILAFYLPSIETDTLFLTEPPFMTAFLYMLYFIIRASQEHKASMVYLATVMYVICIYFRPTVALYPVVILLYLLMCRYPLRALLRQAAGAAAIVVVLLSPWWIRNFRLYHKFVPFTDGTGNPLLLGTYQGRGYPGPSLQSVLNQIVEEHPWLSPVNYHADQFVKYQQQAAEERIRLWHEQNPGAFWDSYLHLKPFLFWSDPYYPLTLFKVHLGFVEGMQVTLVIAGLVGLGIALLLLRGSRRETAFFALTLLYFTALYAIFFVYGRYNEPFMPLMFLGIGAGLYTVAMGAKRLLVIGPRSRRAQLS